MSDYFIHPTAVVDEPVSIGEGTRIWHFSHIMKGARVGPRCNLGQNVFVATGVILGANVKVQNNVSLYAGVEIEDNVFLGPSAVFTNVGHPRSLVPRRDKYERTLVRSGATIGANATLLCGRTIGRFAFIGAGAVVTRDVPDYGLVLGTPGRLVGWMCACGYRLEEEGAVGRCPECAFRYRLANGTCQPEGDPA